MKRSLSVKDVIRRILPNGSVGAGRPTWTQVPWWPPDLFAVVARLVEMSGCYARTPYLCGLEDCSFDDVYRKGVEQLGQSYAKGQTGDLQPLWSVLWGGSWRLVDDGPESAEWWSAAMQLLAIADEACAGVGFAPQDDTLIAFIVFEEYLAHLEGKSSLPYLPRSLCVLVSPDELCVQPKTRTPQIGCTLRSLSHNLALLPSVGEVETEWNYAISAKDDADEPLNVLLIPFPYEIRGGCFKAVESREHLDSPRAAFFDLEQCWLDGVTAAAMASFIQDLITEAKREVTAVHAVVLPEGALSKSMAQDVAEILGKEGLELFVTGVISKAEGGEGRNETFSAIYNEGVRRAAWSQSKHHRWKLDEQQIKRYHLGHVFGKRGSWWEHIDISKRRCHFYVFRHGASTAVLICEDLARIDPVQTVVRSVGPNLVIALLMDGPQLEKRWPGRYATVLADDPGSAVLTLTSMGLIRRSNMPSGIGSRNIALWKEPLGNARELELPPNAHSLLLTLSPGKEENVTGDGRSDRKNTTTLKLTGVMSVRSRNVPAWLNDVR